MPKTGAMVGRDRRNPYEKNPLNKADYYETFPAYLDGISRKFGEKPAITYFTRKQEAVTASYAQLTRQALCAAHALQALGYAGKHLAIVAENSYDWLVAYLAIASAGAAAVCIDVEQSDENIRQMIAQATPLVCSLRKPTCPPAACRRMERLAVGFVFVGERAG